MSYTLIIIVNKFIRSSLTMYMYIIRLSLAIFIHYFQNQMVKNFRYAFNMSIDTQIHVSRRACVLCLRPRVATLPLKHHANYVPSIPRASRYQSLPCVSGKSVITNKPE